MSARTPGIQARSQYHSYWGRYTFGSFSLPPAYLGRSPDLGSQNLPNSSGNILSASEYAKLEAGDIAATQPLSPIGPPLGFEFGLFTCIYPGTLGGGDAVWVRCDNLAAGVTQTIRDAHFIVVAQEGVGWTPTTGVPATDTLLNLPQVAGVAADFIDTGNGAELANALVAALALSSFTPCDIRLRPCNINLDLPGSPATPLAVPVSTSLSGSSESECQIAGKSGAGGDQRILTLALGSSVDKLLFRSPAPSAGAPAATGQGLLTTLGSDVRITNCFFQLLSNNFNARSTLICIDTTTGVNSGSRCLVDACRFAGNLSHAAFFPAADSVAVRTQGSVAASETGTIVRGCTVQLLDVGVQAGGTTGVYGDIAVQQVLMTRIFRAGVAIASAAAAGSGLRFTDVRVSFDLTGVPAQPQTAFEVNVTGNGGAMNNLSIIGSTCMFLAGAVPTDRNFIRIVGEQTSNGATGIKLVGCGVENRGASTGPATDAIVLSNITPDDDIRGGDILCDWANISGAEVSVLGGSPIWEHAHSV